MESSLLLCVDANISLIYHYKNSNGREVVVPFSVTEMKDILGCEIISESYRQEVMKRWLPAAFSAASGSPMTYQGMTDACIMYTLMLDADVWEDDVVIDQPYMVRLIRGAFDRKEPGRIFPLVCLYSNKGEDLTLVNAKDGTRKNGMITYYWLCNVYQASHSSGTSSFDEELPPLPPDRSNGTKTKSSQVADASSTSSNLPGANKQEKALAPDAWPTFQGGDSSAFSEWVTAHLNYPKDAKAAGISGTVRVRFLVNTNGSVKDVELVEGVFPSLDAEALRVIKSSPKWKPAVKDGRPVPVTYTIPVIFTLY